jgi:hypothetical protein
MMEMLLQPVHLPLLLAAACMVAAAGCRRMTHVRAASIAAAALLLMHGLVAGVMATAALGALLLPLHIVRLVLHRRAVARMSPATPAALEPGARMARRGYGAGPGYGRQTLPVPTGLNLQQPA